MCLSNGDCKHACAWHNLTNRCQNRFVCVAAKLKNPKFSRTFFEELSYKDFPRGFQLHIVERPLNTAFMILMKPCCNGDVMTRLILPGCGSRNMSSPHDPRLNGTSPPIGNASLYLLMASTADPITIILLLGGNYAISQLFQLATAGVVFLQLNISTIIGS